MKEIEAKFKLKDPDLYQENSDFKILTKKKILDIYFDHPKLDFSKDDKVLRLRKENAQYFLTYKGPREKHQSLLVREELEFPISQDEIAEKFILALGFIPQAKAEKTRIYLKNKYFPKLQITIDQYPFIKDFLEIEGNEEEIEQFCQKYQLDLNQALQKNCTEIFLEYCKENQLPFEQPKLYFTFDDEKNLRP
ncbi:class IV adenylate cyclase [Candidatus Nomurabacteria bacterium]|nr:class IV adenylate cyclase [Candidatus Nomurabacteria bacterium]